MDFRFVGADSGYEATVGDLATLWYVGWVDKEHGVVARDASTHALGKSIDIVCEGANPDFSIWSGGEV